MQYAVDRRELQGLGRKAITTSTAPHSSLSNPFSHRYDRSHYLGVVLCLGGLCLLIFSDWWSKPAGYHAAEGSILGDSLCLCGAACYAVSNVGQEWVLKGQPASPPPGPTVPVPSDAEDAVPPDHPAEAGLAPMMAVSAPGGGGGRGSETERGAAEATESRLQWQRQAEFLGMLGLLGAPLNLLQLLLLERRELGAAPATAEVVGYVVGFGMALFLLYSLVPRCVCMPEAVWKWAHLAVLRGGGGGSGASWGP